MAITKRTTNKRVRRSKLDDELAKADRRDKRSRPTKQDRQILALAAQLRFGPQPQTGPSALSRV